MFIPDYINQINKTLSDNGHKAYLVGGCIRDYFLDKKPKDYDIASSATPTQIKMLFDKVIPTGEQHGTVTVMIDGVGVEVTTLRKDGEYKDSRHPESIEFTDDIVEDLSRRDFTSNAIAYDFDIFIDPFNGINDIKNKVIKAVGNPNERFREDALRMMRAVRFASTLNFTIKDNTKASIKNNAELINNISNERISDELSKILLSDEPSYGIRLLDELDLLEYIIPELKQCVNFDQKNPHHSKNVFDHILSVLDNTDNNLVLRLAALFHDIAKPLTFTLDENNVGHFYKHHIEGEILTKEILQRLKFDNKTIDQVCILVREHMSRYDFLRTSSIKKFINRVGIENLDNLFKLQMADIKGSKPPFDFSSILNLQKEVEKILNEKQPLSVKDLDVNGYDLMTIGIPQGKQMGEILNNLLEYVLESPDNNKKEILLLKANKILFEGGMINGR